MYVALYCRKKQMRIGCITFVNLKMPRVILREANRLLIDFCFLDNLISRKKDQD